MSKYLEQYGKFKMNLTAPHPTYISKIKVMSNKVILLFYFQYEHIKSPKYLFTMYDINI